MLPQKTSIKILLGAVVINGEKISITYDTQGNVDMASMSKIADVLNNQEVSILCSVGVNGKTEGLYLQAQIDLFAQLLKLGKIKSLAIVGADTLQRHMQKIADYLEFAAFVARKLQKTAEKLNIKNANKEERNNILDLREAVRELVEKLDRLAKEQDQQNARACVQQQLGCVLGLIKYLLNSDPLAQTNQLLREEMYLMVEHFDLHILLQALRQTFNYGNIWHKNTLKMLKKYPDLSIPIIRWGDILGGTYNPTQERFDLEQLDYLRQLEGYAPFTTEQRRHQHGIIEEKRVLLEQDYAAFLSKNRAVRHTEKLVSKLLQDENIKVLGQNLEFQQAAGRTTTDYLSVREHQNPKTRQEVWSQRLGFPVEFLRRVSYAYLLEEGASWFSPSAVQRQTIVYADVPLEATRVVLGHACTWVEVQIINSTPTAQLPASKVTADKPEQGLLASITLYQNKQPIQINLYHLDAVKLVMQALLNQQAEKQIVLPSVVSAEAPNSSAASEEDQQRESVETAILSVAPMQEMSLTERIVPPSSPGATLSAGLKLSN